MNKPHPHKDLIIAWANGEKIEFFSVGEEAWLEIDSPNWLEDVQYRIKPQPVIRTFQVALYKGIEYYTITVDQDEDAKLYEGDTNFIAWLTDPIPYQVEELN